MKCKYCHNNIDKSEIRCNNCDDAFQEGIELGKRLIKSKLKDAFEVFEELKKEVEDE